MSSLINVNRLVAQRRPRAAAVIAAMIAASAMGASADAAVPARRYPPTDTAAVAKIFDPALSRLGLRVTRSLVQGGADYEPDPRGSHLALYVEPISAEYQTDDYITNIVTAAKVFLPKIFERWRGLRSFDVCQEPLPGVDDRDVPPPVTQIAVSRQGSKEFRWQGTTLPDVIAESRRHTRAKSEEQFHLYVNSAVLANPEYQRQVEKSRE